jgi:energy-coupling factor transporter ATP-binding protein EcfA2
VLILDEPTASLSSVEAERLFAVLHGLRSRGLAILYISHRIADLQAVADRVVVLRGGVVAADFQRPVPFDAAFKGAPDWRHFFQDTRRSSPFFAAKTAFWVALLLVRLPR